MRVYQFRHVCLRLLSLPFTFPQFASRRDRAWGNSDFSHYSLKSLVFLTSGNNLPFPLGKEWERLDLNQRLRRYQHRTLPLSYAPKSFNFLCSFRRGRNGGVKPNHPLTIAGLTGGVKGGLPSST